MVNNAGLNKKQKPSVQPSQPVFVKKIVNGKEVNIQVKKMPVVHSVAKMLASARSSGATAPLETKPAAAGQEIVVLLGPHGLQVAMDSGFAFGFENHHLEFSKSLAGTFKTPPDFRSLR
ncbi:unnamed protein product [Symbiodinium sp. CCMP2592]|nr:unnamed protein product [Symbiodinium sp. CCMP2592]